MSEVVIVGGGFAGVWSAAAAARAREEAGRTEADLSIALVAPGDALVIRPRLYEAAPGDMRVPLDRILAPVGVSHVRAGVTDIDVGSRRVLGTTSAGEPVELSWDRLVLATGSALVRPALPGAEHLFDVDTLPAAVALDDHLHELPGLPAGDGRFTAVVIGSGFTGLEAATELVGRLRDIAAPHDALDEVRVVLVERAADVGPELGDGPRPAILEAIAELGIELRLDTTVVGVDDASVQLSDGSTLAARTAVWSAGMRADTLTERIPAERDRLGRLLVDPCLRVEGVAGVFAAGDTAAARVESGEFAMQSCQHASAMGKHAGYNVVADLLGLPLAAFEPEPYVTCLDLGAAGAVFTKGFDRAIEATGAPAKELKRRINRGIYPPVDDAAEIMRAAHHLGPARVPKRVDTELVESAGAGGS